MGSCALGFPGVGLHGLRSLGLCVVGLDGVIQGLKI